MRDDWWAPSGAVDLNRPGIYEWTITGVGRYVGKAGTLKRRIREYPNNVRKLLDGQPYRKKYPTRFRAIHHHLYVGRETGRHISVTVLEHCARSELNARERYWIQARLKDFERGGLPVLNNEAGWRSTMNFSDLPCADDFDALFEFALSFDGYRQFGSFEACAAAAAEKSRDSLDAIRNELFFTARATRHTSYDTLTPTYVELQPLFHRFLAGA